MAAWRVSFRNGRGSWKIRLKLSKISFFAYRTNKIADRLLRRAKKKLGLDLNNS